MVAYKIGKGKLWMDGSDRVTVPIELQTLVGPVPIKMLMVPSDKREDVWTKLTALCKSTVPDVALALQELDGKFALSVLSSAEKARQDPTQLRKLSVSKQKADKGVAKSRAALGKRILSKKEIAFKASVQDLLDRGVTKAQLYQLVRDAIVEGVHLT